MFKKLISIFFPFTCLHCDMVLKKGEKILCSHCFSLLHEMDLIKNDEESFVFDGNIIAATLLKQYERSWDRLYIVLASYMILAIDRLNWGGFEGVCPYLLDKKTVLIARQMAKILKLKFMWKPKKNQNLLMIGIYRNKNRKAVCKTLFFIKN